MTKLYNQWIREMIGPLPDLVENISCGLGEVSNSPLVVIF
jgi:hypothetical protein